MPLCKEVLIVIMAMTKSKYILAGVTFAILLANVLVYHWGSVDAVAALSPLGCPLKRFFDIFCPTCGLTRSLLYTLTGQWATAWRFHFMGPILVFVILLYSLSAPLCNARIRWLKNNYAKQTRLLFYSLVCIYSVWGFLLRDHSHL